MPLGFAAILPAIKTVEDVRPVFQRESGSVVGNQDDGVFTLRANVEAYRRAGRILEGIFDEV